VAVPIFSLKIDGRRRRSRATLPTMLLGICKVMVVRVVVTVIMITMILVLALMAAVLLRVVEPWIILLVQSFSAFLFRYATGEFRAAFGIGTSFLPPTRRSRMIMRVVIERLGVTLQMAGTARRDPSDVAVMITVVDIIIIPFESAMADCVVLNKLEPALANLSKKHRPGHRTGAQVQCQPLFGERVSLGYYL
jgi:hypothetical protein